ncbi:S-adenosyl-L-methionine-dependent methyltransferases superfamily protein [Rhynchospora pubera]|uniref:S-adenosyl-L-methionine-dependent methyltransferases superfamily protein n=1 Tax=Rhynchospora pubera TaxID=906938 RepID=A0AAV8H5B1_9POAL|nr:S-adenosyl-L-methionine-dependent methyltransferases superfamily protein [Rhynchospora pubera]
MGKKKHRESHHRTSRRFHQDDDDYSSALPSSAFDLPPPPQDDDDDEEGEEEEVEESHEKSKHDLGADTDTPSKFDLYQLSVQSPKGDISYMLKFFLMYVGGRQPLHLQEDFCGTALLSTEWLRSDPRRTAVGLDLDLESLDWCLDNNLSKVGSDVSSRLSLFHGNVLQPYESPLVCHPPKIDFIKDLSLDDSIGAQVQSDIPTTMGDATLPARDIVCAFNYSCCCLHSRKDLIAYFRHALNALSRKGGIFVMDLYGGTSSECKLRLQRKFSGFTYIWEQEEFDVINRKTKISLHFQFGKKKALRHAFSYHWRLYAIFNFLYLLDKSYSLVLVSGKFFIYLIHYLYFCGRWSIPEIKDCMEEAGFKSVHFWMREMPDTHLHENADEYTAGRDVKYEELSAFRQRDAWNAYVVAVTNV